MLVPATAYDAILGILARTSTIDSTSTHSLTGGRHTPAKDRTYRTRELSVMPKFPNPRAIAPMLSVGGLSHSQDWRTHMDPSLTVQMPKQEWVARPVSAGPVRIGVV